MCDGCTDIGVLACALDSLTSLVPVSFDSIGRTRVSDYSYDRWEAVSSPLALQVANCGTVGKNALNELASSLSEGLGLTDYAAGDGLLNKHGLAASSVHFLGSGAPSHVNSLVLTRLMPTFTGGYLQNATRGGEYRGMLISVVKEDSSLGVYLPIQVNAFGEASGLILGEAGVDLAIQNFMSNIKGQPGWRFVESAGQGHVWTYGSLVVEGLFMDEYLEFQYSCDRSLFPEVACRWPTSWFENGTDSSTGNMSVSPVPLFRIGPNVTFEEWYTLLTKAAYVGGETLERASLVSLSRAELSGRLSGVDPSFLPEAASSAEISLSVALGLEAIIAVCLAIASAIAMYGGKTRRVGLKEAWSRNSEQISETAMVVSLIALAAYPLFVTVRNEQEAENAVAWGIHTTIEYRSVCISGSAYVDSVVDWCTTVGGYSSMLTSRFYSFTSLGNVEGLFWFSLIFNLVIILILLRVLTSRVKAEEEELNGDTEAASSR